MFKSILHFLGTHKALLAQILLIVIFIGALVWAASISTAAMNAMPPETEDELPPPPPGNPGEIAPLAPQFTLAVSPTPANQITNQNETDGIIFAGIVLVLIIVVGTLGVIRQKD